MTDRFNMEHMVKKGYSEVRPGVWEKGPNVTPIAAKKRHKYNARSKDVSGVHYDSQREYDFKVMLDFNKIPYNMKEEYTLQPRFVYQGEIIRALKIIPDFTIYNKGAHIAIVDIKGMTLPDFKIKVKLLKHKLLFDLKREIPIFMPKKKEEMNETVRSLLILLK